MSKRQTAVQEAWKRVGDLVADRERLLERIVHLEAEQATASVERLQQIASEMGSARAAVQPLDAQIEAARREVAAAQAVERQEQIAALQRRDAEIDGEIKPIASALLDAFERKRGISRELHALGADGRGVPLGLWDALGRYVGRVSRPQDPAPQQRRADELRVSLQRAYRSRAALKQSIANDHAAQSRRADVDRWIARDEAELRALGGELPTDEPRPESAPVPGMTAQQEGILDRMRQRITEAQGR